MKYTSNPTSKECSTNESVAIDKKCKKRQSNKTKEKIYKEVFQLMLTQNIEKITISVLEEKLNLTRGAIFYYFSNKDKIIEMTMQHYITIISDKFFPSQKSVQNSLESYILDQNMCLQNFLDWLKTETSISKPCFAIMNFYIQAKTFFPYLEIKMYEFMNKEECHLAQVITNAIQNKEIKEFASPVEIAKILINLYLSIFFRASGFSANENIDVLFLNQQTKNIYDILKV